jgi:hypothetical protein
VNAAFDPLRDFAWIAVGSFVALYLLSAVVKAVWSSVSLDDVHFVMAHLIFVPIAAALILWSYQHPERFENDPDAWMNDLRPFWPFLVIVDAYLITWFIRKTWFSWRAKAYRLLKRANRLMDQGKVRQAESVHAELQWILDNKLETE